MVKLPSVYTDRMGWLSVNEFRVIRLLSVANNTCTVECTGDLSKDCLELLSTLQRIKSDLLELHCTKNNLGDSPLVKN
jgi:hypothetical protein